MPGYTCIVAEKDMKSFDSKYLCPSCGYLLRDPVQTSCGHRYCKSCVQSLLRMSSSKCLVDSAEITMEKIFEDKFAQREILSLPVQCTNQNDGCNWTGELGQLEDHAAQCPYTKVRCMYPSCGVLVQREDLSRHLEEECMFRQQHCQYCKLITTADQLKEHEENDCEEYPVNCPKCSTVKLPRKQLSSHLDPVNGDCEAAEMLCAFQSVGCKHGKAMKRKESRDHQDKEAVHHLSYLLLFVQRLSDFCYSKLGDFNAFEKSQVITSMGNAIESLLRKVDAIINESSNFSSTLKGHGTRISNLEQSIKRRLMDDVFPDSTSLNSSSHGLSPAETKRILQMLENQDAKAANHEVLLVELNSMMQNQNKEVKRLETQLKSANDEIRKLQRRSEYLEHTLSARNFAISELEEYVNQEQFSSFDGVLIWKITDFARRRNEAITGQHVSTYSPCFYTSRHGYKMCARIYLNGDGKGKGRHISVFFVIMRGQYDALLRWPFKQKITFMLMDQDNVEHVIDSFRPDPSSSSFQRPRRETNIASECPTFCSLSELNKRHSYVKDDTMFIKVIVDTTDI